jgi:hypothetical protein
MRLQLFGVAFLLLIVVGCKKKEERLDGEFLQPLEQQIRVLRTDTMYISTITQRVDSVRSDGATYQTLGSYVDPIFGLVSHGFATQVRLSTESIAADELATYTLDSCVLSFVYAGRYGRSDKQNFRVYELNVDVNEGVNFYNDVQYAVKPQPVGELLDYVGDLDKLVAVNDDTENPQMRFRLSDDFGERLLKAGSGVYASNSDFLQAFKGFVVKAENAAQTVGTGAIYYFDLLNEQSRLMLYYRDNDGAHQRLEFIINSNAVRVNQSANNYAGSEVEKALGDAEMGKSKLYIQSMAGTRVEVRIPNLEAFQKEHQAIVINKAELLLNLEPESYETYSPMSRLYAFELKEDGSLGPLADQVENHYNGELSSTTLSYGFGITRYVQNILLGKQANHPIVIRDLNTDAARVVLSGPEGKSPAKLILTYFELNQAK